MTRVELRLQVWVVLAVCLLTTVVRAEGKAALETIDTIDTVEELQRQLDYDGVVRAGKALIKRGHNPPAKLLRLFELVGRALIVTGDERGAAIFFRRLLALEPNYQLGDDISPKIRAPLVRVLSRWAGRPGLTVTHRAPKSAVLGRRLSLSVRIVSDPLRMVDRLRVRYRLPGTTSDAFAKAPVTVATVPKFAIVIPPAPALGLLRYTIDVLDAAGNILQRLDRGGTPFFVGVALPPPAISRPVARSLISREESHRRTDIARTQRRRKIWRYSALGAAIGCATAAATLYAVGLVQGGKAHDNYRESSTAADLLRYGGRVNAAKDKLTAGHVLAGTAALAAAITVYLWFKRPAAQRNGISRLSVAPGAASAVLSF